MIPKDPKYIEKHFAGVIESKRRRSTGTVVTVYDSEAASLDTCDIEGRTYSIVCEEHSWIVGGILTQRMAKEHARCPEMWCEICQDPEYYAQNEYGIWVSRRDLEMEREAKEAS